MHAAFRRQYGLQKAPYLKSYNFLPFMSSVTKLMLSDSMRIRSINTVAKILANIACLCKSCFILQEYVPIVSILCNVGMRPRHWQRISEIAGFDLTPDSGSTLRKMLKLNLEPFVNQFEEVSVAASKVRNVVQWFLFSGVH